MRNYRVIIRFLLDIELFVCVCVCVRVHNPNYFTCSEKAMDRNEREIARIHDTEVKYDSLKAYIRYLCNSRSSLSATRLGELDLCACKASHTSTYNVCAQNIKGVRIQQNYTKAIHYAGICSP